MAWLRIVLTTTGLAVVYGVLHDLVTVHVAPTYFTVAHPTIVETDSLVLLARVWGVVATWWGGALAGCVLGWASLVGPYPRLPYRRLLGWLLRAMALMATAAACVGVVAWWAKANDWARFPVLDAYAIPVEEQARFMGAAGAHLTSYAGLAVATVVLTIKAWRWRLAQPADTVDGA